MFTLAEDLSRLESTHPELRARLGEASTLEHVIVGFRERLDALELVIQDEFSRDVLFPIEEGEFLVLSAG